MINEWLQKMYWILLKEKHLSIRWNIRSDASLSTLISKFTGLGSNPVFCGEWQNTKTLSKSRCRYFGIRIIALEQE